MAIGIDIWLGILSDLMPVSAIIYFYKRFDNVLKLVGAFLMLSALSDVLQPMFLHNNSPIIHIYLLISILLFGFIYYLILVNPIMKRIVALLTIAVLIISIINVIFIEPLLVYPSITNTALSLMLVVFSLMYFYQLLTGSKFVHIEKLPFFWVNTAVLLFYSMTIFLFMLFKNMSIEQVGQYFIINVLSNIIANILFTIGLSCKPNKTT